MVRTTSWSLVGYSSDFGRRFFDYTVPTSLSLRVNPGVSTIELVRSSIDPCDSDIVSCPTCTP